VESALEEEKQSSRTILLPTLDNLRNFFLTAPTEMLSFFQEVREAA
jgi:hypothetical protein